VLRVICHGKRVTAEDNPRSLDVLSYLNGSDHVIRTYQDRIVALVKQDPGVPISLAVYRFLRGQRTEQPFTDGDRRFAYAVVSSAITDKEIFQIKEGPSVRLYPAGHEVAR
jgi:hypothetical protein